MLIKNFIDKDANFFYVSFDQVIEKAAELNAIPFDVPGVELTLSFTFVKNNFFIPRKKTNYPYLAIGRIKVFVNQYKVNNDKNEIL